MTMSLSRTPTKAAVASIAVEVPVGALIPSTHPQPTLLRDPRMPASQVPTTAEADEEATVDTTHTRDKDGTSELAFVTQESVGYRACGEVDRDGQGNRCTIPRNPLLFLDIFSGTLHLIFSFPFVF